MAMLASTGLGVSQCALTDISEWQPTRKNPIDVDADQVAVVTALTDISDWHLARKNPIVVGSDDESPSETTTTATCTTSEGSGSDGEEAEDWWIRDLLEIGENPQNIGLECAKKGVQLEDNTVTAILTETTHRMGKMDSLLVLRPVLCTALAYYDPSNEEIASYHQLTKVKLQVCMVIWSDKPRHYTYMDATRETIGDNWKVYYSDSLPSEHKGCKSAAKRIAQILGFVKPGESFPNSLKGAQEDAWSCGLWASWRFETRLRLFRKEAPLVSPDFSEIMLRVNKYIKTLKTASSKKRKAAGYEMAEVTKRLKL